jgi:hypothetical protein
MRACPRRLGYACWSDLLAPRRTIIDSGLGPAKGPAQLLFDFLRAVATSSSPGKSDGRQSLRTERRSFQDCPMAVADLRRIYCARPRHPIRVSGKRWSSNPRSGVLGAWLTAYVSVTFGTRANGAAGLSKSVRVQR